MSARWSYLIGWVTALSLLLFSVYLQFVDGIQPCPLCTLQRMTFVLLGCAFLFGFLLHTKHIWRLVTNAAVLLFSSLGIFLAGRQVLLQLFPSSGSNECGVSLQYLIEALPFNEAWEKILRGSAECAERGWEFLHFNMAEWSFICFLLYLLASLYLFFKEIKWHH